MKNLFEKNFYIFECTLPFPISLPQKTEIDLNYQSNVIRFIHVERLPATSSSFELPQLGNVSCDRFGTYSKSRIAIVFNANVLQGQMTLEERETYTLEEFFAFRFFGHSNNTTKFVVGAINRVLKLTRVCFFDWHVSPITPKDLSNVKLLKQSNSTTTLLGHSILAHQVMNSQIDTREDLRRTDLVRNGLKYDADLEPLASIESEIHDQANRGDFFLCTILMGTIVELALKKHLTKFLTFGKNMTLNEAEGLLKNKFGRFYNIGEFVDPKKTSQNLLERHLGWKCYETSEYLVWNSLVRERRNEALHSGPVEISGQEIEAAWKASCDLIMISYRKNLETLLRRNVTVSETDALFWFTPLSKQLFSRGLIGDHFSPK